MPGSSSAIGLDRHVGKSAKDGAKQVQYEESGVAGDDERVPNNSTDPTEHELQYRPGINVAHTRNASDVCQLIPPLRLRLFRLLEVYGR